MAKKEKIIAPSILSANFARLGEEVGEVISSGADWIHFDVMDNHFVPNLTIGPMVCKSLRDYGVKAPIDVHLMVEPVDSLIQTFGEAGATYITFHPEASKDVNLSIESIVKLGCKSGLVLNPDIDLEVIEDYIPKLDMILLMSVFPGFGGQEFISSVLSKIKDLRKLIDDSGFDIRLEVDGGIKLSNIEEISKAGADTFVAGSAIFGHSSYKEIISKMRKLIS
ncbi:MAG: ribulose-phosphate 3-epimerase [SAR86 cluster bacterium]|jgi:ribulose-phosphate 3-epimerase|nr:ribulose-phosphate 3-epimerase [SAR86 cluster bacterium]